MGPAKFPTRVSLKKVSFMAARPTPAVRFLPAIAPFEVVRYTPVGTFSSVSAKTRFQYFMSSLLTLAPTSGR